MDAKKEIFVKSLRKLLTITACLSQSQRQIQANNIQKEEINRNTILRYAIATIEKLPRILKSHKIRSTFYTCYTDDKNNIDYVNLKQFT